MIKCELKDIDAALQTTSKFCTELRRKIKKLKTTHDDVNAIVAYVYMASDYLTKIDNRVDEIVARDR